MLEAYLNQNFKKFSYIILNNNLNSPDMSFRCYTQIKEGEQLVAFKQLKKPL